MSPICRSSGSCAEALRPVQRCRPGGPREGFCMRKGLGLLFAISLVLPVGVMTASSAGAPRTRCCRSASRSPAPRRTSRVCRRSASTHAGEAETTTKLTITGCTGGGITSGKSTGSRSRRRRRTARQLFADAGKPGKPTTGTITWSNGQTSTTSNVLTVTGKSGAKCAHGQARVEVHGGPRQGQDVDRSTSSRPRTRAGARTAPFTKSTFKSTSITSSRPSGRRKRHDRGPVARRGPDLLHIGAHDRHRCARGARTSTARVRPKCCGSTRCPSPNRKRARCACACRRSRSTSTTSSGSTAAT